MRLRESRKHHEVGVKVDALQTTHAQRGEALAGGPLHDPCAGDDECEGLCRCDEATE